VEVNEVNENKAINQVIVRAEGVNDGCRRVPSVSKVALGLKRAS
jgi:hypothetical protein